MEGIKTDEKYITGDMVGGGSQISEIESESDMMPRYTLTPEQNAYR